MKYQSLGMEAIDAARRQFYDLGLEHDGLCIMFCTYDLGQVPDRKQASTKNRLAKIHEGTLEYFFPKRRYPYVRRMVVPGKGKAQEVWFGNRGRKHLDDWYVMRSPVLMALRGFSFYKFDDKRSDAADLAEGNYFLRSFLRGREDKFFQRIINYPRHQMLAWAMMLLDAGLFTDPIQIPFYIGKPWFASSEWSDTRRSMWGYQPVLVNSKHKWNATVDDELVRQCDFVVHRLEVNPFFASARLCELMTNLIMEDDSRSDPVPKELPSAANLSLEVRKKELRAWLKMTSPYEVKEYCKRYDAVEVNTKRVRLRMDDLPECDRTSILEGIKNRDSMK